MAEKLRNISEVCHTLCVILFKYWCNCWHIYGDLENIISLRLFLLLKGTCNYNYRLVDIKVCELTFV
jgi:hypothetical protein